MNFVRAIISVLLMPCILFAIAIFVLVTIQIVVHETLWKH
jgi:hypothetical protein